MYSMLLALISILAAVSTTQGYHILCYHPIPSKSHDLLARGLIKPLIKAGHKITWVTPYPSGKPENVTIIDVSQTIKISEALDMANRQVKGFEIVKEFASNITKAAFTEELQRALVENHYDAVITEWFFSDVEAGFAAVQQVPWILLSGIVMHPHMEHLVDTVRTVSTLPVLINNCPIPMTFWDRVKNTFTYLMITFDTWLDYNTDVSKYESYFRPLAKARGVTLPPYSEAIYNASILFVNSHPSFSPAQSLPPNVVEIAGYHIDEDTPPLPKDLQQILNASTQGVVYFSMGSVVKSAALPERTKRALVQMFSEVPYTVLWKFEDKMEDLPRNVHVRSWMPQASILAHPNVKLFISHGGLLSSLEALKFGIPMLAVPVFGDQPTNANRAVRAGYAVKITFGPDMTEELMQALHEMMNNDRYYKRAKELSRLFGWRAATPSAQILHYVELAIESRGAYHLRSKTHLYKWYEVWMIDQAAALLAVLAAIILVIKKIVRLFTNIANATTNRDKKNN